MLNERDISPALAVARKMYTALSEVLEATADLSDALRRQDQVSFQLYLSMRQDSLNQLQDCRALLQKQCAGLPQAEGQALREILSGTEAAPAPPGAEKLAEQARRNRALWERAVQADQAINRRLGGGKSYYAQQSFGKNL